MRLRKLVLLLAAFLCGLWVIADGVGSIVVYWSQSLLEHLVRVVRIVTGVYMVVFVRMAWKEKAEVKKN